MDTPQALREAGYIEACALDEIPQLMPKKITLNARRLLLCRDETGVFAVDEICPHKQRSMQFGLVFQGTITCPHHQYVFELDNGRCRRRRCPPLETYPVVVLDERVFILPE